MIRWPSEGARLCIQPPKGGLFTLEIMWAGLIYGLGLGIDTKRCEGNVRLAHFQVHVCAVLHCSLCTAACRRQCVWHL